MTRSEIFALDRRAKSAEVNLSTLGAIDTRKIIDIKRHALEGLASSLSRYQLDELPYLFRVTELENNSAFKTTLRATAYPYPNCFGGQDRTEFRNYDWQESIRERINRNTEFGHFDDTIATLPTSDWSGIDSTPFEGTCIVGVVCSDYDKEFPVLRVTKGHEPPAEFYVRSLRRSLLEILVVSLACGKVVCAALSHLVQNPDKRSNVTEYAAGIPFGIRELTLMAFAAVRVTGHEVTPIPGKIARTRQLEPITFQPFPNQPQVYQKRRTLNEILSQIENEAE
jgi:hypothetical protein